MERKKVYHGKKKSSMERKNLPWKEKKYTMVRKKSSMVRKKSSMVRKKVCHGEKSYHGIVKLQKLTLKTLRN